MENEIKAKSVAELWNDYFNARKAEIEMRSIWLDADMNALLGKDFYSAFVAYDNWLTAIEAEKKAEMLYHNAILKKSSETENK